MSPRALVTTIGTTSPAIAFAVAIGAAATAGPITQDTGSIACSDTRAQSTRQPVAGADAAAQTMSLTESCATIVYL